MLNCEHPFASNELLEPWMIDNDPFDPSGMTKCQMRLMKWLTEGKSEAWMIKYSKLHLNPSFWVCYTSQLRTALKRTALGQVWYPPGMGENNAGSVRFLCNEDEQKLVELIIQAQDEGEPFTSVEIEYHAIKLHKERVFKAIQILTDYNHASLASDLCISFNAQVRGDFASDFCS